SPVLPSVTMSRSKHRLRLTAFAILSTALGASAVARNPIPIEALAHVPEMQSASMSTDGETIVALVTSPGTNGEETAIATWRLDDLDKGPVVTPSGERMKFIAAAAMKAGRILAVARQEWTGQLTGCGE